MQSSTIRPGLIWLGDLGRARNLRASSVTYEEIQDPGALDVDERIYQLHGMKQYEESHLLLSGQQPSETTEICKGMRFTAVGQIEFSSSTIGAGVIIQSAFIYYKIGMLLIGRAHKIVQYISKSISWKPEDTCLRFTLKTDTWHTISAGKLCMT
jgi:hypothetical protein